MNFQKNNVKIVIANEVKQSREIGTLARRSAAYSAEVAFGYVGRVSAQARRYAPRNDNLLCIK